MFSMTYLIFSGAGGISKEGHANFICHANLSRKERGSSWDLTVCRSPLQVKSYLFWGREVTGV